MPGNCPHMGVDNLLDTRCALDGVVVGGAKRTRREQGVGVSGGALLSLRDLDKMHGQPPPDRRSQVTVKAEGEPVRAVGSGVSGGGGRSARNTIVKDVFRKHGLSLPAARVKEHTMYGSVSIF